MENNHQGMTTEFEEETKEMMLSDTSLPSENGIPESLNDPSYTDTVNSTDSRTALLQSHNIEDDDKEYVNNSFPLLSEKETEGSLPGEGGIPESMNDPSYTDSINSTDSRTALLPNDNLKGDDKFTKKLCSENEPSSNHSSFWDISDFGYEIAGKMSMREKRREREKGHTLLESVAFIDPLVPPSPDLNRLRSVCRNAVQSLSQEVVYRSMSVLAIDEKDHESLAEKGAVEVVEAVEIEVEEIGFINHHLRNLIFLSIGISLVSTATGSLRNLLSSMHHESGIGVYSLAASYGAFTFFSLISPFVVQRFRPKISLVAAIFTQLIYVTANLLPTFYLFIPASFLQGIGNSLMWNAMSTYTSYIARASAIKSGKKTEDVASKYFGIFFFFYQFSFVVGNLISSIVLLLGSKGHHHADTPPLPKFFNISSMNNSQYDLITLRQNTENICGAKFCNHYKMESMHVDDQTAGTLIGIYGMCVVAALILSHVMLDPIVTYQTAGFHCTQIFNQVRSVLKCIFDRKFLLIVLVLMYSMMQLGFAAAEMTKAFVSCPVGIHMVGYTMIAYGICGGFSSWISGILCEYVGRVALISSAACLNLALLVFMVVWQPTPEYPVVFIVLLGVWGIGDGVWTAQVNSIVSALFPDKLEDAFASLRVLQGLGGTVVFCYSNSLCVLEKMYILAAVCIVGTALYIGVEIAEKKTMNKEKEAEAH